VPATPARKRAAQQENRKQKSKDQAELGDIFSKTAENSNSKKAIFARQQETGNQRNHKKKRFPEDHCTHHKSAASLSEPEAPHNSHHSHNSHFFLDDYRRKQCC
jgi:hypothetical protein